MTQLLFCDLSTPIVLSRASELGYINVVEFLSQKGADVNAQGEFTKIALSWANENNHIEIIELLKDTDPTE